MTNDQKNKHVYTNLVVDDVVYRTTINKAYANRKAYKTKDPGMVTSFMPGNIQEVFVAVGDEVREGDRLCILEAMKMKNIIVAPFNGVVTSIHVTVGDRVPKNHVLIELT
jgi:biotin carboxyl carrier protein